MNAAELEKWRALEAQLPDGYSLANLRLLEQRVDILPDPALDDAAVAAIKTAAETAGGPPIINADGKPTVLKVVKWMCHAGHPNLNGQMFVQSELETAAQDLFQAPNLGVMDWNHGAVYPYDDEDPKYAALPNIGVWYDARWEYDKNALGGQGAWGILVTGVMFAWLFPAIADFLMLEQAREGRIRGSMACIPQSVEFSIVGTRNAEILHNPIFMTHSLLGVAPADPDAVGHVAEDPSMTNKDLEDMCMQNIASTNPIPATSGFMQMLGSTTAATLTTAGTLNSGIGITNGTITLRYHPTTVSDVVTWEYDDIAADKEPSMTEQEIEAMQDANSELESANLVLNARITTLEAQLEAAQKSATACETCGNVCSCVKLAELETARAALVTENEAAMAKVTALESSITELTAKLAVFEAEVEARNRTERLATRLAELPETVREALEKRDEASRTKLVNNWADLSDDDWSTRKEELSIGFATASLVDRSNKSAHTTVLTETDSLAARLASHIR